MRDGVRWIAADFDDDYSTNFCCYSRWGELAYYRRVCGPEAGGYPGRSTLEGWLARWALYLSELKRFSDLPLYLQYLCKILFHVVDRAGKDVSRIRS